MFLPNQHVFVSVGQDGFQLSPYLFEGLMPQSYALLELLDGNRQPTGLALIYQHIALKNHALVASETVDPRHALAHHAIHALHLDTSVSLPWKYLKVSFHGPAFRHKGERWRDDALERESVNG